MPPGVYALGDLEVTSDGITARLGDGRLAGSVLRLDQAIRNVRTFLGWSVADAVATVTSVPARLLNVADRHGVLAPGAVFDAVLLTPELEIVATFIAGRIVHAEDALASRFADVGADPT
jgi:N-acetylglucosamine-6-phosphate deacetylase